MEASVVEPVLSDVDDEWGRLRPALEKLCADNPTFGLQPGHVYDECMRELADLWTVPDGFVVTKLILDANGDRTLFLWVAATFAGNTIPLGKYLPFFDEVARHTGSKYIECWSSREGMERYLAKQGFGLFFKSFRKTIDG